MSAEILIDIDGGPLSGRMSSPAEALDDRGRPLIVALHGGSYSSGYFDIPGFSLLERGALGGCLTVALDRPGYGTSPLIGTPDGILAANAARLDAAIGAIWRREGARHAGVVLVGHSIGAAIAALIAAGTSDWSLLGIALSGIGLTPPPGGLAYEGEAEPAERQDVPEEIKSALMFGPPGSYAEDAPHRAAMANQPVVLREIVEINNRWPDYAADVFARVRVPVHYRQGSHDMVWARGEAELDRVRRAFTRAPSVDAALIQGVGHSIDLHHAGAAFQESQLTFAMRCVQAADRLRDPGLATNTES